MRSCILNFDLKIKSQNLSCTSLIVGHANTSSSQLIAPPKWSTACSFTVLRLYLRYNNCLRNSESPDKIGNVSHDIIFYNRQLKNIILSASHQALFCQGFNKKMQIKTGSD